jgi:outer membrane receptor protein involved in Fe transport
VLSSLKPLFVLTICWLVFGCLIVIGQDTGIVKGVVKDAESKETLLGANVILLNDKSTGVASDLDGKYSIELPVGEHQLICTFTGMSNDTFTVAVLKDQITTHDVLLNSDDRVLDVIVVSAGKFEQNLEDLTVSMEVISPDLIENRNTTSIETALEQTPGLTILDQEPQIRGGSGFTFGVGSRVAIVVDGMPLLTGDAGRPEWGFIPVENLAQIEVIKGASSVLYGSSALSGVINIRTAYPKLEPITKINVTTGVYSTPSNGNKWWNDAPLYGGINFFHSRIIKKNLDLVVGGNFFSDHGYIGPPIVEDPVIDTLTNFTNDDVKSTRGRLNFNLRYRSKKIEGLSVGLNGNGMLSKSNFALAWLNDTAGLYQAYPGAISLQDQVIFNLDPFITYHKKNGVRHNLRTRIFHTDNQITNNQSNTGTLLYGEYQLQRTFPFIPNMNFTGGAVGTVAKSDAELYSGGGSTQNQIVNLAGYSQIDKKLWTILNLSAGLRFEYFKMNDVESIVKPIFRAGLSLKVMKGTTVRYSHGQGFRFPTITERFILTNTGSFGVFPNPDLEPETSTNSEIGIKQGFKIGSFMGYLDLAGFHQEFENTIEYLFGIWDVSVAPAGFKFLNTGNTRVRGLDISIMGVTDTSKDLTITLLGGYTYVLPISLNPDYIYALDNAPGGQQDLSYNTTSMDTTDDILKYRFQHTAKIDMQIGYKKLTAGFSVRYYSKIRNIDKAFQHLEALTQTFPWLADVYYLDYWDAQETGITLFDVRAGVKINDNMKVSIVVNNLLNTVYSLRPMKIESPRTSALQLVYKF